MGFEKMEITAQEQADLQEVTTHAGMSMKQSVAGSDPTQGRMLRHHASLEEVLAQIFEARGLDREIYATAVGPDESGQVILWSKLKQGS
jgi:hypothetical protein